MNVVKDKEKTIIIVQARMGSTRLPGKILKKVMGRPLLEYRIERLKKIQEVDDVVIATTINQGDDPIVKLCKKLSCSYFRGSENDVLLRYHDAAIKFGAKYIVRINSDCPLIDPKVVKKVIKRFRADSEKYDYVANILESSYPIGLHTEVFSLKSIQRANSDAKDPIEREHVTPYMYRNPDLFRLGSVILDNNLSYYRWTVDYPEDFDLVEKIIEGIYPTKVDFDMYDIINYLRSNSYLMTINNKITKDQTL